MPDRENGVDLSPVITAINALKTEMNNKFEAMGSSISGSLSTVSTALNNVNDNLLNGIDDLADGIVTSTNIVLSELERSLGGIGEFIGDLKDEFLDFYYSFRDTIESIFWEVTSYIQNLGSTIVQGLQEGWAALQAVVSWLTGSAQTVFTNVINVLKGGIQSSMEWIGGKLETIVGGIKSVVGTLVDSFKEKMSDFKDTFKSVLDKMLAALDKILDPIIEFFTVAWEGTKEFFLSLIDIADPENLQKIVEGMELLEGVMQRYVESKV